MQSEYIVVISLLPLSAKTNLAGLARAPSAYRLPGGQELFKKQHDVSHCEGKIQMNHQAERCSCAQKGFVSQPAFWKAVYPGKAALCPL